MENSDHQFSDEAFVRGLLAQLARDQKRLEADGPYCFDFATAQATE